MEDNRDEDEAEKEEGLLEAEVRLFVITVEHLGTTRGSVKIKHAYHVNIAASSITL